MREGSSLILAGGKTRNSSSLPPSPGFFSAVDGLNLKNPRHVFLLPNDQVDRSCSQPGNLFASHTGVRVLGP